jgi:hypothetical protein
MWKERESKLKYFQLSPPHMNYFWRGSTKLKVAAYRNGLANAEHILCHFRLVPRYLYFAASPRYFGNCIFVCALYCRKKKNEE